MRISSRVLNFLEHRNRVGAFEDYPSQTASKAEGEGELEPFAATKACVVAIGRHGRETVALRHEANELGIPQTGRLNKTVIDATHTDRGTMKQTFQGVQHRR